MRNLILSIGACSALLISSLALAQTGEMDMPAPGTTPTLTASGRVAETTGTTLTIVTETGDRLSFYVSDPSRLPMNIALDQSVRVAYQRQTDGAFRVVNVTSIPAAGAGKTSTTAIEDEALPQTASPVPVIGLFGLLAIGVGVGLRTFTRRYKGA